LAALLSILCPTHYNIGKGGDFQSFASQKRADKWFDGQKFPIKDNILGQNWIRAFQKILWPLEARIFGF
jgi:hypothetical protein